MKPHPQGFIALISAVIISAVLLALATAIGSSTFFARFDALNREFKRLSLGLAESCITTALGKIGSNFNYTITSDPNYSSSRGGVVVSLGTLYGKPAECVITAPTTNPTPVQGKKTFTLSAKANFNGAFSEINASAIAQDPNTAPVTPPPTCAFSPSAISIPGGQSFAYAWSVGGQNITSFTMDHGIGALAVPSGSSTITPLNSPGEVIYTATVVNPGGSNTCTIVVTVTPPPPSPSCADTVMIFDRTGSMSSSDRSNERNAGNTLTNLYAGVSSLPKIGAGSFGGIDGSYASVPANGQLTASYSTILSTISTLTGSNSSVGSNLGAAITVGATELSSVRHDPNKQKVLIFVSDGLPNEPTTNTTLDTGFLAPTANSANNSLTGDAWTNPANAYGAGTTVDAQGHRHRYQNFGFSIPSNATIRGIEVSTNASTTPSSSQATLFSDSFGTGSTDSTFNESPPWTEGGGGAEKRASGSGNDSGSPDGGRFASIDNGGWICQNINASGQSNMLLSYYWRGDTDTESTDDLVVEYNTNGSNCNTGSGWNTITTQDLNTSTGAWSQRTNIALPSLLNNDSSFLIRFRSTASSGDEDARIDGIGLTAGTLVSCSLGVDLSWNGGSSWTSERTQTLTSSMTQYTLGGTNDLWGRSWGVNDFSNGNLRTRIHASPSGPGCGVDTFSMRVTYSLPSTPSQYALDAAQSAKGNGVNIFSIHYGDTSGQTFMGQLASNSTIPASSIVSASRVSGTVTVTTASSHRLTANQRVQISGVSNSSFNGTYTVTSTPSPTTFTYSLSGTTANATGGTVTPTNLFISPASSAMTGIFQSIGYQVCPAASPSCSNTADDDGDGLYDEQDSGCHTDGNASNPTSYDPNDPDEWTTPPTPTPPAPPPPPPSITIGSWLEVP